MYFHLKPADMSHVTVFVGWILISLFDWSRLSVEIVIILGGTWG